MSETRLRTESETEDPDVQSLFGAHLEKTKNSMEAVGAEAASEGWCPKRSQAVVGGRRRA